ncbi:nucleotide sugar dehydrogenase [Fundidesulfovibrio magnetotacticus]|nr:nucleotide sugar dehydrogenase [Fundidesulfovibrio magnetotacticus]
MDPSLRKMMFGPAGTLAEAIDRILAGGRRVAFCLDDNDRLMGILTQGDVLRLVRAGVPLDAPARGHLNADPVTVGHDVDVHEAKKLIGRKINLIPQVDAHGRLTGLIDLASSEYGFLNIRQKSVAILGLGYVGLTLALVLAEHGFTVAGFDVNRPLLDKLAAKEPPFFETGIQGFLDRHVGKRLRLVDSLAQVNADIFIITVGTPVDPATKKPGLDYIRKAATAVGRSLSRDALVILRSTVQVGTTRRVVIPELEAVSGLKAGQDFHVAYCPERTAEGRALKELTHLPQIVGGLDERSAELASRLFNEYTPTIVRVDGLEAAEMCKLMDNVYRDVRFAFANQVAQVAEPLGLDIHAIIDAVNLNYDRNDIPRPSPGVGGPCLTKDPYILSAVFQEHGLEAPLIASARRVNEAGPADIVGRAGTMLAAQGKDLASCKAFVAGFAFKGHPETSDTRDSTTLFFLRELLARCPNVQGYDPLVPPEEIAALGAGPVSIEEGFKDADVVFVMNNHPSYLRWDLPRLFGLAARPTVFYDAWRMFPHLKSQAPHGILYAAVGVGR